MNITSKLYQGKLGNSDESGLYLKTNISLESADSPNKTNNVQIIFNVDVSGSMHLSMQSVRSSLLSFRDLICGKTPQEMEKLNENEKDQLLRKSIDLTLIIFNDEVDLVWSSVNSPSDCYFEENVKQLYASGTTNLWGGIEKSLKEVRNDKATWIVTMADGNPNEGTYQLSESIAQNVKDMKPENTMMLSFGYGNDFNIDVLEAVGRFSHIENSEKIPGVYGALAAELKNCKYFDVSIQYPPPLNQRKTLFGSRNIEVLSCGSNFNHLIKINGKLIKKIFKENLLNKLVILKYVNLETNKEECTSINIENQTFEIDSNVRKCYYEGKMGKYLHKLYKDSRNHEKMKLTIKWIENKVQGWNEPESVQFKEKLLNIIDGLKTAQIGSNIHRNLTCSLKTNVNETTLCHGYTDIGNYKTQEQVKFSQDSKAYVNHYTTF